jgi:hypothetical protein
MVFNSLVLLLYSVVRLVFQVISSVAIYVVISGGNANILSRSSFNLRLGSDKMQHQAIHWWVFKCSLCKVCGENYSVLLQLIVALPSYFSCIIMVTGSHKSSS